MSVKVPFVDRKEAIRAELIRRAARGLTITYAELGRGVGIPNMGYWMPVLDEISREEISKGLPDITFLVVSRERGLPSQIGFKSAKPASSDQERRAVEAIQEAFGYYRPPRA